ncbi:MAG: 4-hydroxythreonine-4-phosphate dehydrogenase PdxA [Roseovarius sp.]|nr:4-hydroxythreonine-4-phosphate dehydrogenase PdxA [Roseovarius sp.]
MIKPIALTYGEPSGIGPETVAAAWREIGAEIPFFLIGDPSHIPIGTPVKSIESPDDVSQTQGRALPILALPFNGDLTPGIPNPSHSHSVVNAIDKSLELASAGKVSAICTGPINKHALRQNTRFPYPGHTEYLASKTGGQRAVMMLACDSFRVVPATIHMPLSRVSNALSADLLEETIRITNRELVSSFGIEKPRISVAGLNPHAGENGVMGSEEKETISPVLDMLRSEGYCLNGPLSADTMFHEEMRLSYDAAICMYHDQALIPIKTLYFDRGVNITLGLPIIRTSPDHGTALDIAGRGKSNPRSMIESIKTAAQIAKNRHVAEQRTCPP